MLVFVLFMICTSASSAAGQSNATSLVSVTDEHGNSISGAQVVSAADGYSQTRITDTGGRVLFSGLRQGTYHLTVSKSGYYPQTLVVRLIRGRNEIQVALSPLREYEENIEVTGQSTPVDPEQTVSSESLSSQDVLTIPYPATRDYRNVLPYLPGVITNAPGDLHVAGASTQESAIYLDGFEVSQPAAGSLQLRVSPDAVRRLELQDSRYPVQFGKSSGGILNLETQDADNHFRWNVVNFMPTFQMVNGLRVDSWTPRAYLSGPIIKNRLWYYAAHLQEETLSIVKELPRGHDSSRLSRSDVLGKLQWLPDTRHSVSASAVINASDTDRNGISPFDPVPTSTNQYFTNLFVTLRDQIKIGGGDLLELGTAYQFFRDSSVPLGTDPYVFTPEGRTGSFFETSLGRSRRAQLHANFYLRPLLGYGTHQFSAGFGFDALAYAQTFRRRDILFTDSTGIVERKVTFGNTPEFRRTEQELSAYAQDRWSIGKRVTIETGVRWDRDEALNSSRFSPRVAASYLLHPRRELKVSAGWGLYTGRASLDLLTRPLQGTRTDIFFEPGNSAIASTLSMSFAANDKLRLPQARNWSVGMQSRIFAGFYGKVEYLQRDLNDGLGYRPAANDVFVLTNDRGEHYRGFRVTFEGGFSERHRMSVAYTRSRAATNEVLDYSINNPVYGSQISGRLPWDAPNQFVAWGSLPSPWKTIDLSYSLLWRSGLPFVSVNSRDELVHTNDRRVPDYFSLDPAIEKSFSFKTYRLALRVSIDNITNARNASGVNNNNESPTFLQLFGKRHRTLNARIRLLGRK